MSMLDTMTDDQLQRAMEARERDERVRIVWLAWRYGLLDAWYLGEALGAVYSQGRTEHHGYQQ